MRNVEVVAYKDTWPQEFKSEARRIQEELGQLPVHIYHIGSTSVPGLSAKPVIDIMPVVPKIEEVDNYGEAMHKLGYEAMGAYGIEGRRFFKKGGDERTHHVHVFEVDSPEALRHLAFRDYLRARPDVASAYGKLKQRLAETYPEDMESYISGKEEWIHRTEEKAVRWYREERYL